jgi:uncharacterized membrane protein HdeD (DUF308 family)
MSGAFWLIIACGALAIVYGIVAYRQVVAAPAGNETVIATMAAAQSAVRRLNIRTRCMRCLRLFGNVDSPD